MILTFQVMGDYLQLRKRRTDGRILRPAIRDVKRTAGAKKGPSGYHEAHKTTATRPGL